MKRFYLIIFTLYPILLWAQSTLSLLNRMHTIHKGETIQSIAIKYGVSEEEILLANPEISPRKLKKGTIVCIPEPKPIVEEKEQVPVKMIRTNYTHMNIGVVLTFNEKGRTGERVTEFYRGILMATDSVKKEGTNIDLYTWNCGKTAEEMRQVLEASEVTEMNVIIGPSTQEQVPVLAQFCKEHNIRLIIPFANSLDISEYPNAFIATPNNFIMINEAVEMLAKSYANRNYIILKTNKADQKGSNFTEALTKKLSKWGFSPRILNIDGDAFAYETALNQFRDNCIVPDNTSIQTLNIIRSKLDEFIQKRDKYNICLQGYPEWQSYTNTLQKDMFRLDTYLYSNYYFNTFAENTAWHLQQYMNNFNTPVEISYPRFAPFGFDLAYYFIHGIAKYGDLFEQHIGEYTTTALQTPFKFKKENENGGYTNHFIQLIHYTPTEHTELIK